MFKEKKAGETCTVDRMSFENQNGMQNMREGSGQQQETIIYTKYDINLIVLIYLVWPLPRVDPDVSPQVSHLHKGSVAVGAGVGLLPGVQSHVRLQVVVPREPAVDAQ